MCTKRLGSKAYMYNVVDMKSCLPQHRLTSRQERGTDQELHMNHVQRVIFPPCKLHEQHRYVPHLQSSTLYNHTMNFLSIPMGLNYYRSVMFAQCLLNILVCFRYPSTSITLGTLLIRGVSLFQGMNNICIDLLKDTPKLRTA